MKKDVDVKLNSINYLDLNALFSIVKSSPVKNSANYFKYDTKKKKYHLKYKMLNHQNSYAVCHNSSSGWPGPSLVDFEKVTLCYSKMILSSSCNCNLSVISVKSFVSPVPKPCPDDPG